MRNHSLLLGALLAAAAAAGACNEPASPPPDPARQPSPAALVARPEMTAMPGGGLMLRAPIAEVHSLERQPDGTYKRICARPDDQQRAMMERRSARARR